MLSAKEKNKLRRHVQLDDDQTSKIFDALRDANRCKLFRVIAKKPGVNVGDAAQVLGLSMPLVSQHLKVLKNNGLLLREKIGREVFYKINSKNDLVKAIIKAIE